MTTQWYTQPGADAQFVPKSDKGATNGIPTLVGGTIPRAQLPNITSVFTQTCASQAAMLALPQPDADTSLQVIRADIPGAVFWLNPGLSPATLGNWQEQADDVTGAASAAQAAAQSFATSAVAAEASARAAAIAALSSTYAAKAADAGQTFMALVKAQMIDPCVLIVGDSTSISGRWPSTADALNPGFVERLATMFPTHTVKFYAFDTTAALGGPYSYLSPVTISTGSGARTINVYNASWGGHNCTGWKGKKGVAAFGVPLTATAGMLPCPSPTATGGPDLTLISLGHNEGVYPTSGDPSGNVPFDGDTNGTNHTLWWHGQYLGLVEDLAQQHRSSIVVVSQNPTFVDPITRGTTTNPATGISDTYQEQRREVYRKIAERRGYGFIDATQAWLDQGNAWCVNNTSDGTHPIASGSSFWAGVVCKMFVWDQNSMPRPQSPSLFSTGSPNLLRNGDFQDGDDYWTLTGVTSAVDTTNFETSTNTPAAPTSFTSTARKYTADGSGNNFISQRIPVERVRGKWVTVAVRVWVDSSAGDFPGAGVVQIQDSNSTTGTTANVGATGGKDGWRWDVYSKFIDPAATYCIVKIFTNSGANAGANISIDRAWAGLGRWPSDVRRRETGKIYLNQTYTPSFSSNITQGNGTVVARYRQDDSTGLTDVFVRLVFGTTTTINGTVTTTFSLPVNVLSSPTAVVAASAVLIRSSRYLGMAFVNTTSTMAIASIGTNGVQANLSATVPGTWTTGDTIEFRARYFHA